MGVIFKVRRTGDMAGKAGVTFCEFSVTRRVEFGRNGYGFLTVPGELSAEAFRQKVEEGAYPFEIVPTNFTPPPKTVPILGTREAKGLPPAPAENTPEAANWLSYAEITGGAFSLPPTVVSRATKGYYDGFSLEVSERPGTSARRTHKFYSKADAERIAIAYRDGTLPTIQEQKDAGALSRQGRAKKPSKTKKA